MSLVILAYPIEKVPDTFPICAAVSMPLGAEPFAVTPHGGGLAVLALGDASAVKVHHPLFIFPAGVPSDLPLGTRAGAFIGFTRLDEEMAFVFKALPWPALALPGLNG